jgi:rhodanese-related sulfurtransferase/DNA-binding transcriptional ArsR family regulator
MSTARLTKDRIFAQFARISSALASPKRLELLDLLCQCEKAVDTLAEQAGMSAANTSSHLQVLREARLVDSRKVGQFVYYRMAGTEVSSLIRSLRQLAETRLAEIDRIKAEYFASPVLFQPVDLRGLLRRAKRSDVVILDVRPQDEFVAGHLPHAISVPLSELKKRMRELPREKEIVAYCRGPFCVLAVEAVSMLKSRGYKAFRLSDGIAEWKDAGLPVESLTIARS